MYFASTYNLALGTLSEAGPMTICNEPSEAVDLGDWSSQNAAGRIRADLVIGALRGAPSAELGLQRARAVRTDGSHRRAGGVLSEVG